MNSEWLHRKNDLIIISEYHLIVQVVVSLMQYDFVAVRFEFLAYRIDKVIDGIYGVLYLVRVGLKLFLTKKKWR